MKLNIKVTNPDEWKKYFPPAGGDKQWKDGYSALEFAKIVTGAYEENDFEKRLQKVFNNSFKILTEEIYPEKLSKFDKRNGPRHHDLACCAEWNGKKIALCFEAKVYESLDKRLSQYRNTKGKEERCDELCNAFFKGGYKEEYKDVYFQILSSMAGTIAFASEEIKKEEIPDAYFVLYQIIPNNDKNKESKNKEEHITEHKSALNEFIKFTGCSEERIGEEKEKIIPLKAFELNYENNSGKKMKANISIVYIEHEVSGDKLD